MTKQATSARHHFSVNFFGALGYGALLFIWLLVLTTLMGLVAVTAQEGATGSPSFTTLVLGDIGSQLTTRPTSQSLDASMRFGLIVLLCVLGWIFIYFVAKVASRFTRHMLKLFGMKLTIDNLTTFKYFIAAAGLIGLVVLLQFLPFELSYVKVAIALLGLVGGLAAVASISIQKTLAERYHATIARIL